MSSEELSERLWEFAALVGKRVDALPDSRLGRHVAGQLVRCGTSAPPNDDEGCAAESETDFAHKLNIGLKELVETRGWLRVIPLAELLPAKSDHRAYRRVRPTGPHPGQIHRHIPG